MTYLSKAFGLPEAIDPSHEYVYKTGDHGLFQYWYRDLAGNYWEYTNAPEDSSDWDSMCGNAILVPDQPMPHTAMQFYTAEGLKRNIGVPDGVELTQNESYDPMSPTDVWYEFYSDPEGNGRFVYLDSDVKENLDLWVQSQLRIADAGIPAYRKYASDLFLSSQPKDRTVGAVLMLLDQGVYDPEELIYASVEDLEFIDNTVRLMGRKFVCDPDFLDYLTELVATKDAGAPLFTTSTLFGEEPLGIRYLLSLLNSLKMNPRFLRHWHANHQFSRIVHRLALAQVPPEEIEERAYNELARTLATSEDVKFLVDYKVRDTLLNNYEAMVSQSAGPQVPEDPSEGEEEAAPEDEAVEKSLNHVPTDDFGVAQVWSDLTTRRADEREFSEWLHSEPLHEVTASDQAKLDELTEIQGEVEQAEQEMNAEEAIENA